MSLVCTLYNIQEHNLFPGYYASHLQKHTLVVDYGKPFVVHEYVHNKFLQNTVHTEMNVYAVTHRYNWTIDSVSPVQYTNLCVHQITMATFYIITQRIPELLKETAKCTARIVNPSEEK